MATALSTLGVRKAAITLIQLGSEKAATVLSHLSDSEVEAISAEIARLDSIGEDEIDDVMSELREMVTARVNIAQGGLAFAQNLRRYTVGYDGALLDMELPLT